MKKTTKGLSQDQVARFNAIIPALANMVRQPIEETWEIVGGSIVPDLLYAGVDLGEGWYLACLEACLDADRLVDWGGDDGAAAMALIRESYKELGYEVTLAGLAERIRLC